MLPVENNDTSSKDARASVKSITLQEDVNSYTNLTVAKALEISPKNFTAMTRSQSFRGQL